LRGRHVAVLALTTAALAAPACSFYARAPGAAAPKPFFVGEDQVIGAPKRYFASVSPAGPAPAPKAAPPASPEEQAALDLWAQVVKEALSDDNRERPGELGISKQVPELQRKLAAAKSKRTAQLALALEASLQFSRLKEKDPSALGNYWAEMRRLSRNLDAPRASDTVGLPIHAIMSLAEVASGRELVEGFAFDPETYPALVMALANAVLDFPIRPGEAPTSFFMRACALPALQGPCQGASGANQRYAVEIAVLQRLATVARIAAERCDTCAAKDKLWWNSKRPADIVATLSKQLTGETGSEEAGTVSRALRSQLPTSRSRRAVEARHLIEIDDSEYRLDDRRLAGITNGKLASDTLRAKDAGNAMGELFDRLPALEQSDRVENLPESQRLALNVAARADTTGRLLIETAFAAGQTGRRWLRLVVRPNGGSGVRQSVALTLAASIPGCKPIKTVTARTAGCGAIISRAGSAPRKVAAIVVVEGGGIRVAEGGRGRPVRASNLGGRRAAWAGRPVVVAVAPGASIQAVASVLDQLSGDSAEPTLLLAGWR
jgi:hypothetical protein